MSLVLTGCGPFRLRGKGIHRMAEFSSGELRTRSLGNVGDLGDLKVRLFSSLCPAYQASNKCL